MKRFFFTSTTIVLFAIVCWSCSNNGLEEIQNPGIAINETTIFSRSADAIDYSQFMLLENGYVMPRTGESFQGSVTYKDTTFPVYIYWDLEFENYNIYAYISGSNYAGYLSWYQDIINGGSYYGPIYRLDHVATYLSACNNSRFDLIIQCNFSKLDYWGNYIDSDNRHVSFHVIFYPGTRDCSFDIIEEGEGWWRVLT